MQSRKTTLSYLLWMHVAGTSQGSKCCKKHTAHALYLRSPERLHLHALDRVLCAILHALPRHIGRPCGLLRHLSKYLQAQPYIEMDRNLQNDEHRTQQVDCRVLFRAKYSSKSVTEKQRGGNDFSWRRIYIYMKGRASHKRRDIYCSVDRVAQSSSIAAETTQREGLVTGRLLRISHLQRGMESGCLIRIGIRRVRWG